MYEVLDWLGCSRVGTPSPCRGAQIPRCLECLHLAHADQAAAPAMSAPAPEIPRSVHARHHDLGVPGPASEEAVAAADVELARELLAEWDQGNGTSKSQIEIRVWGDATSHGRRFDRFIRRTLGETTSRPSRQTDRIAELEAQVRTLGRSPAGSHVEEWEAALQHARSACLAGLRIWNDPSGTFRTGGFALHFVTAWNSLAIAVLHHSGREWRQLDTADQPELTPEGVEKARQTLDLVVDAFPGDEHRGLRENVRDWVGLRNSVAHRHLPALDMAVIPWAQAGLLNFEAALEQEFGSAWSLSDQLSVPLQLAGFRNPDVVASLRQLQASLPLDVQAILSRVTDATPELLADPSYQLRVAFLPAVPTSGRRPDAVAYFVRPSEVPDELAESLQRFVVLPKVVRPPRPNLGAKAVAAAVQDRIPYKFNFTRVNVVARALGVRPPAGATDPAATDPRYCEWVSAVKIYLYNQDWIDRLVGELSDPDRYQELLGCPAVLRIVGE